MEIGHFGGLGKKKLWFWWEFGKNWGFQLIWKKKQVRVWAANYNTVKLDRQDYRL